MNGGSRTKTICMAHPPNYHGSAVRTASPTADL